MRESAAEHAFVADGPPSPRSSHATHLRRNSPESAISAIDGHGRALRAARPRTRSAFLHAYRQRAHRGTRARKASRFVPKVTTFRPACSRGFAPK